VESDRRFLLNTITGRSVDDAVVDDHSNYDELNNILRGIFVTPALERIIKEKDFDTITRCLDIVNASNSRIINLFLYDCSRFNDSILIKLADSLPPTLTNFTLWSTGCSVTVKGINACLEKIVECPQLANLNLEFSNIDDDGAKAIADALKTNHSLKTLHLWGSIGDDGAKQIADALKVNHSLEALHLSNNSICDDGAKQIADALRANHSLKTLNLSSNNIGNDGAKQIADALKVNHSLETFDLGRNKLGADCKEYLSKTLQGLKSVNRDINITW
jgi:hypothetical protein